MSTATISLIIMGICIVLFVTEWLPGATAAMLGCVAMVAFGVCSFSDILSGFGGMIVWLVFAMQIIGLAMFTTGAASMVGKLVIKLSKNDERRFIFIACVISAVLSAFLTNTAVISMMIAICSIVVKLSDRMKIRNIILPVAVASILGGQCTLVGSTPQLAASGILESFTGEGFSMFSLAAVGIPITVAVIAFMTFVGYPLGKKIFGKTDDTDIMEEISDINLDHIDKTKIILFCSIFGLTILLFVTGWVDIGTAALFGAILCIATGCIKQKEVFEKMNWNVIIWLGFVIGIVNAVDVSGGAQLVADVLLSMFGDGFSPFLFFTVVILLTMVMSEFFYNTATLMILMPPILSMAVSFGMNPYPIAYGMTFAAALTFATPLANGQIALTLSAGYKFIDYFKYGILPSVLIYLMIIVMTPLLFPLI